MSIQDKLIEAVAKVLFNDESELTRELIFGDGKITFKQAQEMLNKNILVETALDTYFSTAENTLKAINEAGFAVVPREPTEEMQCQGAAAGWPHAKQGVWGYDQATETHKAMIDAGQIILPKRQNNA